MAYSNRHDTTQPGLPHADSETELSHGVTALYYTNADSRLPAGGYTIFYDAAIRPPDPNLGVAVLDSLLAEDGQQNGNVPNSERFDVAMAVRPLAGRLIIFDSRFLHHALPPSVPFPRSRYSTAVKFTSKMAS